MAWKQYGRNIRKYSLAQADSLPNVSPQSFHIGSSTLPGCM